MMRDIGEVPYENLANAIILLAVKDYRDAIRVLKRYPRSICAQALRDDTTRFFLSEWFGRLTELDGEQLYLRLRKEAGI